jgi:4-hydroxy-3-polyprenylbenzoate decarboxylase
MEDSSFGWLIHELVATLTPQEFPGLKALHAVDAAGVHPLLLAIGEERYMPFRERVPEEIITIGNRILGSGQTSLAKFLFIVAAEDNPDLDIYNLSDFFQHVLQRVDWTRDLHFYTKTTMDTLDYSGSGWNAGSKVLIACRGDAKRVLAKELSQAFSLPTTFSNPRFCLPGVLAITAPPYLAVKPAETAVQLLCDSLEKQNISGIPLIILCDDSAFISQTINNFVWVTFTRANPSHDIYGVSSFTENKHWGCKGSLIIDARKKPHHAPELETDPDTENRVRKLLNKYGY